ncbi:uncharacterized hydrophobic protein (TIGR00271 family) [Jatrophihabitans sp. GAS493]|uniref:DUF389 domain-containing protein n=1 Tax=Jatrophihabitans sp. GAS493 TaxID=1907575 RepID=UPI000BC02BD0|nr:DUF389 domain-containing protein [Jatrophihabitans sp. GAS493]SOD72898.1 uncharacterized hydrophobic protein (TIGR00271 family) [Jatrophihabitans sp. GAS493]
MISSSDIDRMREQLFFEGVDVQAKLSRFWLLLCLASVIASAGVAGDSTATVIGAMIVAPLMTPILGIVLAMVLNDRANLIRSIVVTVTGAAAVVAIGFLIGLTNNADIVAATNTQVAARVSPRLIDLLAALATGAVGSIALVRKDISDTLPGVAIAISLVPPLSVVGLTLESGAGDEARGALLLFVTNVSAILASGVVIMAIYGLLGRASPGTVARRRRRCAQPGVIVVAAMVLIVAAPLTLSSIRIAHTRSVQDSITDIATMWAGESNWSVDTVDQGADNYIVRVLGPLPEPDPNQLRHDLDTAGLQDTTVEVDLVVEDRVTLNGH